ncbi:MAG: hypothetical protein E6J90_21560 [Deltaproteobacteria bacterium]|nr:MAG: hypothetical protein E6J90_21560 [Deltaproteobacteria bacterium]
MRAALAAVALPLDLRRRASDCSTVGSLEEQAVLVLAVADTGLIAVFYARGSVDATRRAGNNQARG